MLTDLDEIGRRSKDNAGVNLRFRRFLKAHHQPDGPFRILAERVQHEMDCTQCANCCRQFIVGVTRQEIEVMAAYVETPVEEFIDQYTEQDPDDSRERVLLNRDEGCAFLDGNLCMVYDARPKPCREFPHLALKHNSLGARMATVFKRAPLCPIIYNSIERYKQLVGYQDTENERH
ncbi:MAG: YkgJ family cysteine cluster protein [Bryobacteraceae bacterium]|nr:YkgJ family cysteine cluster protein [Bryobacteraceae bacterium]